MRVSGGLVLVNIITITRLLAGILTAASFYTTTWKKFLAWGVAYIFLSDLLDGRLARGLRVTTRLGALLDYGVDRFNFYLFISVLATAGASPLAFTPFLLRDLLYVAAQAYARLPKITGTKAASFLGTSACYIYLLVATYYTPAYDIFDQIVFFALFISLLNLLLRLFRVREQLLASIIADLS